MSLGTRKRVRMMHKTHVKIPTIAVLADLQAHSSTRIKTTSRQQAVCMIKPLKTKQTPIQKKCMVQHVARATHTLGVPVDLPDKIREPH